MTNDGLPEPAGVIIVGTQALRAFTADQLRAAIEQERERMQAAMTQELQRHAKMLNAEFGRREMERLGLSPRALELSLQTPGAERLREFVEADQANYGALRTFLSAVFARGQAEGEK